MKKWFENERACKDHTTPEYIWALSTLEFVEGYRELLYEIFGIERKNGRLSISDL